MDGYQHLNAPLKEPVITAPTSRNIQDYLTDLQERSLAAITLFVGLTGAIWLVADIWSLEVTRTILSPPAASWLGAGICIGTAVLSHRLAKRRSHTTSSILVWGSLAAVSCAALTIPLQAAGTACFFIVPILFASVLFSESLFRLTAFLVYVAAVATNLARSRAPADGSDVILTLVILVLVTIAAWFSIGQLQMALEWAWRGYRHASHNERLAEERQAELARALKAMDESSYRLERANYMLAVATKQAEEARRLKQQFAQTISHELRTPLNLIVGFTELMIESSEYYGGQLSPLHLRDLGIVHRSARHLQSLVNDVLDLARIDAAQMGLAREEVDPVALVQEVANTARSLVESQGLALHTELASNLPRLWLDPTRIRQVLLNLLNNAAHFTEAGSVTISVWQQGDDLVFAVKDTGVGIAPDDVARIFEEFEQVDSSVRRRHEGTGLGLAISKRFVTLHGGRIWAHSQPGKGSTFYFSLPLHPLEAGALAEKAPFTAQNLSPIAERPTLLVITPSLTAAALLTRYVHGCHTVTVPDLPQGRQMAREIMPQVVVIDSNCGTLDSTRLDALSQSWELPGASFVACPLPCEGTLHEKLAVDAFLVKPISREDLWNVLRGFGEEIVKVLIIDDNIEFVQLMSRMLDDAVRRYTVISAYNGREGLAMLGVHRPDLVLLDIKLPDIPGTEIIKQIRSTPEWHTLPIVVVSAQDELDISENLSGAVTVAKPDGFSSAEVVRWVQRLLDDEVTPFPKPEAPLTAPSR